jgi:hypothetical protein
LGNDIDIIVWEGGEVKEILEGNKNRVTSNIMLKNMDLISEDNLETLAMFEQ